MGAFCVCTFAPSVHAAPDVTSCADASTPRGRRYIGAELNKEYLALTHARLAAVDTDVASPLRAVGADFGPLFAGGTR